MFLALVAGAMIGTAAGAFVYSAFVPHRKASPL
jgi:hypothetical protein